MNRLPAMIILIAAILIYGCTERVVYTDIFNEEDMIPVFKAPGGTYDNEQYVTITTVLEGTTIRYTLDGTIPNDSSAVYSDTLYISRGTVIHAEASKPGWHKKSSQAEYKFQTATPSFNLPPGDYDSPQFVEIFCETDKAVIRYTTDGSEPDTTSALYSDPIFVGSDKTLKATAFRTGWLNSEVAAASYQAVPVAAPAFEPPGGKYFEPQIVTINCATEGAIVRFTTDGTEPDSSSDIYTSPIAVTVNTTIRARAFKNVWGNTSQSRYSLIAANPTFNPPPGEYNSPQYVEMFCQTPETVIRYTDDGSEPDASSTVYSEPILVSRDTVFKAKAYRTGWYESQTVTSSYQPLVVATPAFDPPGGEYIEPQRVTISCATAGAAIRYTVDGTEPDSTSSIYTEPIDITKNTTIKARAFKNDWGNTSRSEYTFLVSKPTFDLPGGEYPEPQILTIKSTTEGSNIRYTKNGYDPTQYSTLYTEPIIVDGNMNIKARAFKENWNPSVTTRAEYSFTVSPPSFYPPAGSYSTTQRVTISIDTQGATIRYTTDGNEPTSASAIYSDPIDIPLDTTLKAKGFKERWNASHTVSADYNAYPLEGMVYVEGGTFIPATDYIVTLTSFYIGRYEVTQEDWTSVMEYNPSRYSASPDRPVERVSWFKAIEYCNRRSMMWGLDPCYSYTDGNGAHGTNPDNWPPGWDQDRYNQSNVSCNWEANGYRLPTEMEWEFAARGGVPAQNAVTFHERWAGTNIEAELVNFAWYLENTGGTGVGSTQFVGTRRPNELGLYDMSGNVSEWCWDRWTRELPTGTVTDPTGPEGPTERNNMVKRGGCWAHLAFSCYVASSSRNYGAAPMATNHILGFRVARRIP